MSIRPKDRNRHTTFHQQRLHVFSKGPPLAKTGQSEAFSMTVVRAHVEPWKLLQQLRHQRRISLTGITQTQTANPQATWGRRAAKKQPPWIAPNPAPNLHPPFNFSLQLCAEHSNTSSQVTFYGLRRQCCVLVDNINMLAHLCTLFSLILKQ